MQFTPESRAQWRDWLRRNHARHSEAWVVFFKKRVGRATLSYEDAVEEALCFGWIDGVKRSVDANRYMYRFTPRKPDSKWSATNKDRALRLLGAGRMAAAGKRAIERAKANGHWARPVAAPTSVAMPPELEDELRENAQAAAFFESLPPSARRQYMAWIACARRPDTRKRRLNETLLRLSRGQRLGMK